ncbi:hypothetical protein [Dolichospermum sp. UHCC 0259]|uniref:hypothetical protein n=1 Tax=Dolichospermum sp. UHCC 0259 TaxID=2590010 RepID=UPI00144657FF|nr:hypothetical protein [Dolichospermum sp. UHCC 0259]MTJ47409.1 hypothetical protein [Dolichospermum sp. UHCC 0259]
MDALNHGEIVGTHHFFDAVTDHAAQNFSDINHDLNSSYSSHVESISQGLDQHSHNFSNDFSHDFNPGTIIHSDCIAFSGTDFNSSLDHLHNSIQIETPSFDHHLSTSNFHAEVMPREATPDYAAAANNEGWAKHYEGLASSWANGGSYDMAASLQKDADYHHQKAAENLNQ